MSLDALLQAARQQPRFNRQAGPAEPWYRIRAHAAEGGTKGRAELYIYDEIGGWWGTTAQQFADELRALDADHIDLHLNSPGGDYFDGVAIYNALRQHKASVTVYVDALAASAASFVAQAGDRIVMNRGSQMMIHDAWGLAIGNAADMQKMAGELNKISDSMAGIYVARAGGSVADWREVMSDETWYTADEAVKAGLADETTPSDPPKEAEDAKARWDLSVFAYAGREKAPNPFERWLPPKAAAVQTAENREEGAGMDPAKIREALGLAADASDDEVRAAFESATSASNETGESEGEGSQVTPPAEQAPPSTEQAPASAPAEQPVPVAASATLPQEVLDQLARQSAELAAIKAERRAEARRLIFDAAVRDGKIKPADRAAWESRYDKSEDAAAVVTEILNATAKGAAVPVAPVGEPGSDELSDEGEFEHLFPPHTRQPVGAGEKG